MSKQTYNAIAEIPVDKSENDKLGLGYYTDGLVKYIKNCNTPTTIAVQGDWGSGKTSMLNMICDKLNEESFLKVRFNTWQYSQFEMADSLSVSFLTNFLSGIQEAMGKSTETKSALETIKKVTTVIAKKATVYTAGRIGGDDLKEVAQEVIDNTLVKSTEEIDLIKDLKEKIERCIEEVCEKNDEKRIVVFVDDLDRLNPVKAVELLEIIKIFLDCEGCIFVLAVDTNVIKQGISQKHGLTSEKAQAFFEKLIQLPFEMPVDYYDYEKYVENIFPDEGEFSYRKEFYNKLSSEEKKNCVLLLKLASEKNPRAAKRIVNAFIIQDMVMCEKAEVPKENLVLMKEILLALSCIQVKLLPDYQMIVDMLGVFPRFSKWLSSKDKIEFSDEELQNKYKYSDGEIKKYRADKISSNKMVVVFKELCLKYNESVGDGGLTLCKILQSTNGKKLDESNIDCSLLARIILNEFQNHFRELRKKVVLECLEENKDKVWYDDAIEVLEASKKEPSFLTRLEMLDKIQELSRNLNKEEQQYILSNIMELYEGMDSMKFRYSYSKMIKESFNDVIAENFDMQYKRMQKIEDEFNDKLEDLDIDDNNMARLKICTYLMSLVKKRLNEKFEFDKNEAIVELYDEIKERILHFFAGVKVASDGKGISVSRSALPSLFSIAVMLDSEENKTAFKEVESICKKYDGFTREEIEILQSDKYKDVWKADLQQRISVYKDIKSLFIEINDKEFVTSFEWLKEEGEALKRIADIPKDYEKKRLKWYFGVVSFIVYCQEKKMLCEKISELRKQPEGAWKYIFNAVDIITEEYLSDRTTNDFFGVSNEMLEELKLARSNADGWIYENLDEDFMKYTLGMVDEFLAMPLEILNSPQGSYELGMLVGRHFDESAYAPFPPAYVQQNVIYDDLCCFEKREDTFLWKYYEIFRKVINQLRLNNESIQTSMRLQGKISTVYFMHAENDCQKVLFDGTTFKNVKGIYKTIGWDAVKKIFEADLIYDIATTSVRDIWEYFRSIGSLLFSDIPAYINFLENGTVVSEDLLFKNQGRRHGRFFDKYNEMLECLREIAE